MVKGLQTISGKWYYLDEDGRMATEPVVLTPQKDGGAAVSKADRIEPYAR